LAVLAAITLGLLVVAGIYGLYERSTKGRLASELRNYTVMSDTVVRITFEVRIAEGERGECKVRARGRDGLEKGAAVIPVGPGRGGVLVRTYELTTTSRAVTGELVGCQSMDER
jgi:hypothetical protein